MASPQWILDTESGLTVAESYSQHVLQELTEHVEIRYNE